VRYCDACHSSYPDDFTVCPRDQSGLRSGTELQPGMILRGKYEILERIGRGGMASVYRARHRAFGEIRAIKVVGATLADHDDFLRRFRQEAVVARKLHHPHAVRVEDLDTTEDGRPFIVMEYVEGLNLRELIRQEGPLSVPRSLRIAQEISSALAAAHGLGIVHRDIKPDNVLMTRGPDGSETAKVLDFGIAKVMEGAFDTGAGHAPTQTGVVVGTPQYISPEQAMGKRGDEVDGRSDLYSLGVVLYEMVTGRLPFQSDTAMGLILHHLQTAPTPPHLVRPELGLPSALSDVLMKALQKDRERRFASADEMLRALQAVPVTASRTPPPLPLPMPLGLPSRTGEAPTPQPPATLAGRMEEQPTRAFPKTPQPVTPVALPTSVVPPPPLTGGTPPKRRLGWRRILLVILAVGVLARWNRSSHRKDETPQPSPSVEAFVVPDIVPDLPDDASEASRRARDEILKGQVEHMLKLTPLTRDETIEVEVDEGTVTLTGKVSRGLAVEIARALASSVPGVKKVESELEVQQEALPGPPGPEKGQHPIPAPRPPVVPPGPRFPPAEGTPEADALKELLESGRKSLAERDGLGALAAYSSVLAFDPTSREAHQGMARAKRLMTEERARERRARSRQPPDPQ
jgi:serine/threonine protein kinase